MLSILGLSSGNAPSAAVGGRVHGATDGHLRRLWQRFSPDPLHGEKGGQLRYPLCVGKSNAEHGPGV